jgi:GNAT superfamily N-acetyltransferase
MERSQVREATRVLVRAFDDSPIMRHLMPGASLRARGTRRFFHASIVDALPFGEVWVASDGASILGAMVWLPPGRYPPSPGRQLRQLAGLWAIAPVAPRAVRRSLHYLRVVDRAHPKDEHWYLGLLGVDPSRQGGGIGTQLLGAVLPRIDADGRPAYLETDKERNIPYYARQRFAPRATVRPDEDGPPTWTMWRPPA